MEPAVIGAVDLGLQGLFLKLAPPDFVKLLLEAELGLIFGHPPGVDVPDKLISCQEVFAYQRIVLPGRMFGYVGAHAIHLRGYRMIELDAGVVISRDARASAQRQNDRQ